MEWGDDRVRVATLFVININSMHKNMVSDKFIAFPLTLSIDMNIPYSLFSLSILMFYSLFSLSSLSFLMFFFLFVIRKKNLSGEIAAVDPDFPEKKNCMKMKKIGPRGGPRPKFYVDPPLKRYVVPDA